MEFQTQPFLSKTGNLIQIREPEVGEAQKLVDLKRSYIKNTTTIPMHLDEYPNDFKNEAALITEYKKSSNSILLVAAHKGELIGNIDLTGSKRSKMFHTGMIGMGIKEQWRNQGLGKYLIQSVINWAKDHTVLEIIWLDVYASNELGFNLYKNSGFKVSGVIPNFFKEKNGYINKIQMYQHIRNT